MANHEIKKIFLRLVPLSFFALLINGCELDTATGVGAGNQTCSGIGACAGSSSVGSGDIASPVVESIPFTLSIRSFWEDDKNKTYPHSELALYHIKKDSNGDYVSTGTIDDVDLTDGCNIASGTTLESSSSERQRTCGVLIPETRLYYSQLEFSARISKNSGCEVVYFNPLGFRASSSASFSPSWMTSAIDCSVSSPPIDCFSGPAIKLIPGFPNYVSLVHLLVDTSKDNTLSWTAESAHENKRRDNRWSTYYPLTPSPVIDWKFDCVNEGSSLNFSYTLRIIPTVDSGDSVGENWDRYLGWVDENGIFNNSGL